jgi:hypothetical protein
MGSPTFHPTMAQRTYPISPMKLILSTFSLFLALLVSPSLASAAQPADPQEENPFAGEVLCLPGNSHLTQDQCLDLGPAAYHNRMADLGVSFPLRALPGKSPNPELIYLDVRYGQVVTSNAPVYASLEDAINSGNVARRIDSPYSFISYIDEAYIDGRRFYMIEYGGWMTANEVSRIGSPSRFQGLEFKRQPEHPFGWILYPVEIKRTPGFEVDDYTGLTVNRYELVQIYHTRLVGDMEWYMIGPDQWIPEKQEWMRLVGRVLPNPIPPEGVENGRWIEVNLHDQTISVYDQYRLVCASLIASGIEPFWTRPGLFPIYEKYASAPMRGSFEADRSDAYYLEDVPWTMYYDKARALHGAYWHNGFGAVRSHGCVNLTVADSRWIFDWADVGDWVYVWDPSGNTPTDPALYGEGGA